MVSLWYVPYHDTQDHMLQNQAHWEAGLMLPLLHLLPHPPLPFLGLYCATATPTAGHHEPPGRGPLCPPFQRSAAAAQSSGCAVGPFRWRSRPTKTCISPRMVFSHQVPWGSGSGRHLVRKDSFVWLNLFKYHSGPDNRHHIYKWRVQYRARARRRTFILEWMWGLRWVSVFCSIQWEGLERPSNSLVPLNALFFG
jgi:hypothetical protein